MKAVVMEGKKRICVVLCEDGTFRKIRGSYKVGDTIEVKTSDFITEESNISKLRQCLPILSGVAAAAVLVSSIGYYETAVACSYVTLDATPSIEYTLNRLDKVIRVEALNEEAQPIIETLTHQGVKYNSIGDAIDMTVEVLRANDYLSEENNEIIIDVVSESEGRSEKLSKQVEKSLAGNDSSLSLSVLKSDKEDRASAKGSGISTGQFKVLKDGKPRTDSPSSAVTASNAGTVASTAASTAKKPVSVYTPAPTTSDDTQTNDAASASAYTPPSQASASSAPASKPSKKKKKKVVDESTTGDTEVAAATDGSNDAASTATSSEASKDNSGEGASTPAETAEAPTAGSTETPAPPAEPETPPEEPAAPSEPGSGDTGETPAPTPEPTPPAPPAPQPPADPDPTPQDPDPTDEPTLPEIPEVPEIPDPGPDPGEASTQPIADSPSADSSFE